MEKSKPHIITVMPNSGCGALTIMSWKVLVMMNVMPQLVSTQTALATPLTLMGKISDMTSHGMGPQPRAKPKHSNKSLMWCDPYIFEITLPV